MRPRAYHLVQVADYAIGAVFAMSIFVFGLFAFAMSGGVLKSYEMQAIGGAYAGFLARVETEAHALRADYCESAGANAAAEHCAAAPTETA
ncbi:MAG TPA: hypothetical protein VEA80_02895 [Vitreimonas sp.]|uniref:hypothetical protein n=1 Tax=Vitreimonas sp. TaxID=3069702 RepID=UPI002D22FE30|nr:hypothetical protein [Vitreimonas sp.]HYD86400.1 hypothetical protein [Vitreimonas sp.]